jgi:hypothetical protein
MRQDCNKTPESLLKTTFEADFQVGADFQGIDAVRRGQNLEIFGA